MTMNRERDLVTELSNFFLQMGKVSEFNWKELVSSLKEGNISLSDIADNTICHQLTKRYPPSSKYIQLFLKRLISELEACGLEVDYTLYDTYVNLLSRPTASPEEVNFYRTYTLNNSLRITINETKNLIIHGTTGLTTWQASHVLSEYCVANGDLFKRKKVLELGSGLGLAGIALIKSADLKSFTFTDHHPKVLEYLKHNIMINFELNENACFESADQCYAAEWNQTSIFTKHLDWETASAIKDYDFIIGADIIFDKRLTPCLVNLLETSKKEGNCQVILASTIRNEETFEDFIQSVENRNLPISYLTNRCFESVLLQTEVKLIKL